MNRGEENKRPTRPKSVKGRSGRVKPLGISPESIKVLLSTVYSRMVSVLRFLRMLLVICVVSNTVFIALTYAIVPFFLFPFPISLALHLCAALAYSTTYTGDPATTGIRYWPEFCSGFFMQDIIRWFQGDIVKTTNLQPGKQYIFAFAPHGTVVSECPSVIVLVFPMLLTMFVCLFVCLLL